MNNEREKRIRSIVDCVGGGLMGFGGIGEVEGWGLYISGEKKK